jgi:hypothetical protein
MTSSKKRSPEEIAGLKAFFSQLKTIDREAKAAVEIAKPALGRLASELIGRTDAQAQLARHLFLSLYNGGFTKAKLACLPLLPWPWQRDFADVLLALNGPGFSDKDILKTFEDAGDTGGSWFFAEVDSISNIAVDEDGIDVDADHAGKSAREAMRMLAREIACQYSGQPFAIREFLHDLTEGRECAPIQIVGVDWELRRFFCTMLRGFGRGNFKPDFIAEAFYDMAGDAGVAWLNAK